MTAGMSSVTEAVSHLPRACGSRGLPFPFVFDLPACAFLLLSLLRRRADDVFGGARDRGGVVDAGQLGHALAAVLLPGRQPRGELALRRGGGLRGRWAQRARQHHDALPVEGQHQRPVVRGRADHPLQVKRLHVRGGPAGQLLQLPFPDRHAGRAGDRGARRLGRAARGLDRGELPQPVGVLLFRQVQLRVQRVHVRPARHPVRDPRHRDLPELRDQWPGPVFFRTRARNAVLPAHVMPPHLTRGRQVQPVLVQPPQQLPAPHVQLFLQLAVLQPRRIRRQPLFQLRVALPGLRECPVRPRHIPLHRAPSFRSGLETTRNVTGRSPLHTHRHEQTGHRATDRAKTLHNASPQKSRTLRR